MPAPPHLDLSRRERQIMFIVYEQGPSTASEILDRLPDPPSYSAVRTMLRILEEKGHLRHYEDGPRYVYHAVTPREQASKGALRQVLQTFFDGSAEQAVAALIKMDDRVDEATLDRLQRLIDDARGEGR
ncbi:MAG: BlaI/MecI/CopY family transcriptional regulator [Rhodothermales bacterium]|nr:BlaI/MecI/CopY family transcriptional regulator [Rhodothermales bacterium]MCA0268725.1 BlaI/MecI/CopY family transcriptional regulator [Bacteroidota bacterium]